MFSEPGETDKIERFIPNKLEKQDNKTDTSYIYVPEITERVNRESTLDNYEIPIAEKEKTDIVSGEIKLSEIEKEDTILTLIYINNLDAFIKNGLISVIHEIEISDRSSINSEIVNQMNNDDNVTLYSQSERENYEKISND